MARFGENHGLAIPPYRKPGSLRPLVYAKKFSLVNCSIGACSVPSFN